MKIYGFDGRGYKTKTKRICCFTKPKIFNKVTALKAANQIICKPYHPLSGVVLQRQPPPPPKSALNTY